MTDKKKPAAADKPQPAAAEETQALQQQLQELTGALQRERADAINARRRADEQLAHARTAAKAAAVRELLPVIDNFERALKHIPPALAGDDYIKGVAGIVKQFEAALHRLDVHRIRTVGEPFDPRLHEAVSLEDGDGDTEVVTEELQAGYAIGEEVIRHAMVRVGRV